MDRSPSLPTSPRQAAAGAAADADVDPVPADAVLALALVLVLAGAALDRAQALAPDADLGREDAALAPAQALASVQADGTALRPRLRRAACP